MECRSIRFPPPPLVKLYMGRAVTVVELLVVVTLIATLLALSIPHLRAVRTKAQVVARISDCHQIGLAVATYSVDNSDLPPTLFSPPDVWPEQAQTLMLGGVLQEGNWFANSALYFHALSSFVSERTLMGFVPPSKFNSSGKLAWTPYVLTETLFASPPYWTPLAQRPLLGWRAHRLDAAAIPSQKGLLIHPRYLSSEELVSPSNPHPTHQVRRDIPETLVCWFDLSATAQDEAGLRPGIVNRFAFFSDPIRTSPYDIGPPVENTLWGLSGIDR